MTKYKFAKVPARGEAVKFTNGLLSVPDRPIVPFVEGDGTGPDIWRASVRVFDAAVERAYTGQRKVEWMEVFAGEKAFKQIAEARKIDAVLDLVGNSVMLDSLAMLRRGGRSCLAGWLGGLDPIPDFNPLLQMPSGVYLTFFGSFVFGTPGFPLSDVPLREIAADAATGRLDVKPARVFRFDEIREAHRVMEANEAVGKMVVVRD